MTNRMFRSFAVLSAAALATIAVACGAESPAAVPTLVPTQVPTVAPSPKPVPTHDIVPITANPEDDPAGFFAALPESERTCISTDLGEGRFAEILVQEEDPSAEEMATLMACVSDETILNIAIGAALAESNLELSEATLSCVSDRLVDVDLGTLRTLVTDENAESLDSAEMMQFGLTAFPAIFCLNGDERAGLGDAGASALGAEINGATIDALECAFDAAGPDGLATLVTIADQTDEVPPELLAVIGRVLAECSTEFTDSGLLDGDSELDPASLLEGLLGGPDAPAIPGLPEGFDGLLDDLIGGADVSASSSFPVLPDGIITKEILAVSDELLTCLESSLSPDQYAEVESAIAEGGIPDVGLMIAMLECGEDLASESGIVFPVGAETLTCLVKELGEDQVNGLFNGTVTPSFSLITAIANCGVNLSDLSG
ncbi:MAG: hypothetical protein HQ478_01735 [Chloroflexi bacterium]|nr:hypothetical protein [Chloroflexota bacterium]